MFWRLLRLKTKHSGNIHDLTQKGLKEDDYQQIFLGFELSEGFLQSVISDQCCSVQFQIVVLSHYSCLIVNCVET